MTYCGGLQEVHHKALLRCIGGRKRKGEEHILSYASALLRTTSKSVETTVRRQTYGNVCGLCVTHGRGASADEGDVRGDDPGLGLLRRAEVGLDEAP